MERHGLTSFFRRVSHKKTAVLKSIVSKPPFGVHFRLGRVNRQPPFPVTQKRRPFYSRAAFSVRLTVHFVVVYVVSLCQALQKL